MQRMKAVTKSSVLVFVSAATLMAGPRIGQSAITTYAFPWGARSLGMAETFTGVANNAEALFYNPAGLGQSPLAKSWIHMLNKGNEQYRFVSIAAKPNRSLADKEFIWALRDNGEIYKFNGSTWVPYTIHLIDSSETISEISEKFLDLKKHADVESAQNQLIHYNGIGLKAQNELATILKKSLTTADKADSLAEVLAYLPVGERNETDILGVIFEHCDSKTSGTLTKQILDILDKPSEFNEMLEVKVPFNIGLDKSAKSLYVDHSGRLWVITNGRGLWKFDGSWKQYTSQDGLGSDTVLSIYAPNENTLLIGTTKGVTEYSNGMFKHIGKDFSKPVHALTRKFDGTLFAASDSGLYQAKNGGPFTAIKTDDLALTNKITTLVTDSRDRLWLGSEGNVAIYDGKKWAKYQFKGSKINNISEIKTGSYWIATDNGAVEMIERDGVAPEWKVHHAKNGLPSSEVNWVTPFGKDIWLATSKGISEFKSGEVQATAFFEQLLPSLNIDDIWHAAAAGVIPLGEFGTLGFQTNYLFFGEVTKYNPDGTIDPDPKSSFEFVGGLSYGLAVKPNFSLGLSLKYAYSRLSEESKAKSVAVDAGLLKTDMFVKNLSMGFSMLNMGPAVYYDKEKSEDPIPFTLRWGTSYLPLKTPSVELLLALDLDREIVFVNEDETPEPFYSAIVKDLFKDPNESLNDEFKKVLVHTGMEFTYAQLLSARLGYMLDEAGVRKEMTFGLGLKTSVVLADFGMIFTLGENDIRNNQVRFSITYAR